MAQPLKICKIGVHAPVFNKFWRPESINTKVTVYLFNPETDYALADGSPVYTAPASVRKMRDLLALLPALYAGNGNAILLPFGLSEKMIASGPLYEICREKNLEIVAFQNAASILPEATAIRPWGWNEALRKRLADCGANPNLLPSSLNLQDLRELSHRHSTIRFHEFFHGYGYKAFDLPEEISMADRAVERFVESKNLYFKAPWSSSGRGIMLTDDLDICHVEPWVRGIINTQGSVLCETAYSRLIDFASEWNYSRGEADFIGLSLFSTSRRGKYHLNYLYDDNEIREKIDAVADVSLQDIIDLQKRALQNVIGTRYEGPLGIDMFVSTERKINPCVEINFRMTMGMVANHIAGRFNASGCKEGDIFRKLFPDREMDLRNLTNC